IRDGLTSRRKLRSSRRNRKTRYRQPRFLNRKRPDGWLAPSLIDLSKNLKLSQALLFSDQIDQVNFTLN
ncbi:MAG: HNH endonuclease, partial [Moorea sp. SIO4E2]|nr:HNH endonuclease [Moorena sp. SIO4E2]